MMISLKQKIEQLTARYQGEASMPPHEILTLCEALRVEQDALAAKIAAPVDAMVRTDARLAQLERTVATMQVPYQNPQAH